MAAGSTTVSSENIANDLKTESTTSASEAGSSMKDQCGAELLKNADYPEGFVHWVTSGEMLSPLKLKNAN
ncbi:phosphoinositide phosphatase SAC2-like [Quillaja saponaria]|uniref:Phosphoinositide phosphatase SAC2-like n=1 Tax=Quillaja saponaria TaxID=32244 RepID=A0AAD7KMZ8_QUISA|nr:phosphoinositide phosphatase SAC2-like [Quillaja saponaria]